MTFNARDIEILARTIYGEARGEPWLGKTAVAYVVLNRARCGGWWGEAVTDVCLKPWQFSCWNQGDPNHSRVASVDMESSAFVECLAAAGAALSGLATDPTRGATHYHADGILPSWARGRRAIATIGRHRFYRGID